nr:P-loop NTPase [uncultured Desulfobacter sp.]
MKELVILSGKGGTGKTSLTSAFASLAENMMLCDADVDAADLHLIMDPDVLEIHDFAGGYEAEIIPEECTGCGQCMTLCRFDAVKPVKGTGIFHIDSLDCEGCGVCADLCPESAIKFEKKICGQWFASKTRFGDMIHARLGIAEENSGRLVALVREEARKRVLADRIDLLLTDGPPGIGCPVIASMGQASAVLIVTEPTVSGIHDMERVAQLAAHFRLPAMICINKYDLNPDQAKAIEAIAEKRNIEFVGKIPFDPAFTQAMVQGKSIMETHGDSPAATEIKQIWERIMGHPSMKMDRLC